MTLQSLWKHVGMTGTTQVLQWMAISPSQGIKQGKRDGGVISMLVTVFCLEFNDSDVRVKCLWAGIRAIGQQGRNPGGS